MHDLYWGLALLAGVSIGVFLLTAKLAQHLSANSRSWLALSLVLGMIVYSCVLWQSPMLVQWLPLANLIVVGSWFPIFMSALGGCVWSTPSEYGIRRAVLVVALATSGMLAAAWPLLGDAPRCDQLRAPSGFYLQTTKYTCSAASAATLLSMHGIPASEQEMAHLCLTRTGTSWLGLYRGLKLKTAGTKWDVEVVYGDLRQLVHDGTRPAIIEVGLSNVAHVDATFREEYGWEPGRRHSVILSRLKATGDGEVIDPMPLIGREQWDRETFNLLWRGTAMRLVERVR
jgi:hypothetical protein